MFSITSTDLSTSFLHSHGKYLSAIDSYRPQTEMFHSTMKSLHESWLRQVQQQVDSPPLAASIFETERRLLETLFITDSDENNSDKKNIFQFCQTLLSKTPNALGLKNCVPYYASIDEIKKNIGKIIFLAEKDLKLTCQLLDSHLISQSIKSLNIAFDNEMNKGFQRIKEIQEEHEKVQLQNAGQVVAVKKPLLIASMLMTSVGLLNLGIIDIIIVKLFPSEANQNQHDKVLIQALLHLKNSPFLQQNFQKVLKPLGPHLASNDIIRITFKLPRTASPTNHQARIVALSALLSDMHHNDFGTPFMPSKAMKNKLLADFNTILTNGKLVRHKRTNQVDFYPVIDFRDSTLNAPFFVNREGQIKSTQGYLWESPGLIAAILQIGIEPQQIKKDFLIIIAKLFDQLPKSAKFLKLSVEYLIDKYIEMKTKDIAYHPSNGEQTYDLKNLATLAFCSETNTPLIRAWESCRTALAESNESTCVRQKILSCLNRTLMTYWPRNLFCGITEEAKTIKKTLKKVLVAATQLIYDENSSFGITDTNDGYSKKIGAFVLHEVIHGDRSLQGKKIESPEEFRSFILNGLNNTQEILSTITPQHEHKTYHHVIDKIRMFVQQRNVNQQDFLYQFIRNYHPANHVLKHDLANWSQLEHLPFRDALSADMVSVNDRVKGFRFDLPETTRPKNALQLLQAFILFSHQCQGSNNFLKEDPGFQHYTALRPHQAFTLTPNDPSVGSAMQSTLSPSEWIEIHLIQQGRAAVNVELTPQQQNQFIIEISRQLLPTELAQAFIDAASNLIHPNANVHVYCEKIRRVLQHFIPKNDEFQQASVGITFTNTLLQHILPQTIATKIKTNIVRIAETNWLNHSARHISFVCYFDPVSQSLQLGAMDEEGKELIALDQNEWVSCVPWEIYGLKLPHRKMANLALEILTD